MSMRRPSRSSAAKSSVGWARHLFERGGWLALDTETTGLSSDAEPVEIAVLDPAGHVMLHQRIRPECPIEHEATR